MADFDLVHPTDHNGAMQPEISVIIISYNTCDLTLKAVSTLLDNAGDVDLEVVVWDNASQDGSAAAISKHFPKVDLVTHHENIGFAQANNQAVPLTRGEWILLLNPDTETHPRAVETLLKFAKDHPHGGIFGGRTVFPNGSLNPSSCWAKMTPWSLFCQAFGLTKIFPKSAVFNSESMGDWQRDTIREVDIVVGCFFLLKRDLWNELGGFDSKYFMYGEEADLCLRARRLGYRPMVTPDAQIMHLVGASDTIQYEKIIRLMKAKSTLMKDHWGAFPRMFGLGLLWFWIANRRLGSAVLALVGQEKSRRDSWKRVWDARSEWMRGYS